MEDKGSARAAPDLSVCKHNSRRVPEYIEKFGFTPELFEIHIVRTLAPAGHIGSNATYGPEDAVAYKFDSRGAPKGLANAVITIRNDLISNEASHVTLADDLSGWVPPTVASRNKGSSR